MCCWVHGDIFHPPRLLVDAARATLTECIRVTGYTSPKRRARLHKRACAHACSSHCRDDDAGYDIVIWGHKGK